MTEQLTLSLSVPVAAHRIFDLSYGMKAPVPDQGSHPGPLHWEHSIPATGQSGRSLPKLSTYYIYFISLWKEMATHTSVLAWKLPWTEEPGGLYNP